MTMKKPPACIADIVESIAARRGVSLYKETN